MLRQQIAVVDDDEAVRLSTAELLGRAGYDVKLFESGDDLLEYSNITGVSCILLDLRMPGQDGHSVLRELGRRGGAPPVLVITGHGDIQAAVEAMKLGACEFMEKPYDAEDLLAKLEAALNGTARSRAISEEAASRVAQLSDRQHQILQGILSGLQNKIIAHELGLSVRTVETYRALVMDKLGAHGTADAVRLAIAAGLAEGEPAFPQLRRSTPRAAAPRRETRSGKAPTR
jgi:two-component system response regulator FixJ